MEINCVQMDVLLSFYMDGELTDNMKSKVEEHLRNCNTCRAKFNILNSLYKDLQDTLEDDNKEEYSTNIYPSRQYRTFKNNLSAYVDNELPQDENIKIKKYTINNKKARKELEDAIHIRKLMKDSFKKTKNESKPDFSKNILKQMDIKESTNFVFNPLIKVAFAFIMTILFLSIIVIMSLSFG